MKRSVERKYRICAKAQEVLDKFLVSQDQELLKEYNRIIKKV
jgi:hypothetical protein